MRYVFNICNVEYITFVACVCWIYIYIYMLNILHIYLLHAKTFRQCFTHWRYTSERMNTGILVSVLWTNNYSILNLTFNKHVMVYQLYPVAHCLALLSIASSRFLDFVYWFLFHVLVRYLFHSTGKNNSV